MLPTTNSCAENSCPTVPLYRAGTGGTSPKTWDKPWDKSGTNSLKALAHKVLQRDKPWDNSGTSTETLSQGSEPAWDKKNALHMLNRNGLYVEPVPGKGLILHCDYTVSESLEAHIIFWTLGQWDALFPALWRTGPELPRRVQVKSRNRYRLPREGQNENHH